MSEWISVKNEDPIIGERCLALWIKSGHVEDVEFYFDDGWNYTLFDGGTLNDFPTHWMLMPKIQESNK